MKNALTASLEAIDFQRNSTLIKEMGMQFDACLRDPSKDTFNKASEALHKIAKQHTGMHFNFHFVRLGGPNAFVIPPQADIANPMRPEEIATKVQRIGRVPTHQELFKGVVDLKTGKVSGIYADIPIDIFTAVEFFTDRNMATITGDHIAAIGAHEMGHGFTYLRYLGQFVMSSCVVAEITRRQHEGAPDKVIQEVVKVAEQNTGWRLRDLGEINRSTDPLLIQQVVMAGMVESIRSELGTKFYDIRAFEFSADQFVARHGGAHLIVEALDFMYKSYPSYFKEYRGRISNIFASLIGYTKLLGGALMAALSVGIGTGGAVIFLPGIIMGAFLVVMALCAGIDDGVYDPIPKRYEAMRRELIASSKAQYLSTKQRLEIIGQIEAIDSILNEIEKNSKGYFAPDVIMEYVKGIFNGRPGEQKFQRMLENLVNNRLFELSNQLQAKSV
ncbi:hypothetical protein D3C78_663630 [compost metagenome]